MNALFTAIMNKLSGTTLETLVSGRVYLDQPKPGPLVFPYVVFFVVTSNQQDVFKNQLDNILIQFSIFSASRGMVEVTAIYEALRATFDDAALSISDSTLIWMIRQNLTTMVEDVTAQDSTSSIKHWAVDYSVLVQK